MSTWQSAALRRGLTVVAFALTATLTVASCSAGKEVEPGLGGGGPSVGQPEPTEVEPTDAPLPVDQPAPGVPPECAEVYPWAPGPVDLTTLTLLPEDWPQPPEGSTLCTVNTGGVTEMAAYVVDLPAEKILDYYESKLERYDLTRSTGEENGTGYAALEGADGDALTVQIREAERGFLLAFIGTAGF